MAERLVRLPDPRRRRGVRHPFVSVLQIAACAVLARARSYATIGQWAAEAPQHTLARLGARCATAFAVRIAPSSATVRRVTTSVCPGGLADLLGCDPHGADTVAIEGKRAWGSRRGDRPAAHLLAALTGTGQIVTQLSSAATTPKASRFCRAAGEMTLVTLI
ncbi:transposase family protein [Streptomyces sp. NPDC048496]|uniref:transposase family protein n=1 Tax=Streptomyces sp. NPDC048496 TaxID=3365558 RepID=UPI00371A608E